MKVSYTKTGKVRKQRVLLKPNPVKRPGVTCLMCTRYPCFSGIDNMSSNFAEEGCVKYTPIKPIKRRKK